MIIPNPNATCEFCGSKDLRFEQCRIYDDALFPKTLEKVKCCNCGKILYEEKENETRRIR